MHFRGRAFRESIRVKKVLRENGFTLLELIVAICILLILAAVVSPSVVKIVGFKLTEKAHATLQALSKAAHSYYHAYGVPPETISDLIPFLDNLAVQDPWGNPIIMFKEVRVSGILYDVVFLSKGQNTVQDSVLYEDSLELRGDDIIHVVSLKEETIFDKTRQKIALANGALEAYVQTYNTLPPGCSDYSTSCVCSLVSSNFLDGKDSYDLWGSLLYYFNGYFHSSGPDRQVGTADDISYF